MSPAERSPARSRLARGLLVSGSLFALLEGALRIAGFEGPPPGYFFLGGGDRWSPVFRTDPVYLWALKPGLRVVATGGIWAETNSRGLRSPEVSRSPPEGTRRVLCLGDSVTAGGYTAWPAELGRVLRESLPDSPVEVVNAGVPAYSSFQVLRFYEDALEDLRADLVVAMVGFNDRAPSPLPDSERAVRRSGVATVHRALERLRTFRLVRAVARGLLRGTSRAPSGPRVSVPEFRENLARLVERVRERRAVPVFVTEPWFEGPGEARVPSPHGAYTEAMREIAREKEVRLIDLAAEWSAEGAEPFFDGIWEPDGRGPLYSDRIHPNDLGFRLVAETVARRLTAEGLLPGRLPPLPPSLAGASFAVSLVDLDGAPGDEIAAAIHDGEELRLRWFSLEGGRLGEWKLPIEAPRGAVAGAEVGGDPPSLALAVGGFGGKLLRIGPEGSVRAESPFEGVDPDLLEVGTDPEALLVSGRIAGSPRIDRLGPDFRTLAIDVLPGVRAAGTGALSMAGGDEWPPAWHGRLALALRGSPPSISRGLIGFFDERRGSLEGFFRAFWDNPAFPSTRLAGGRSSLGRPLLLASRGGVVRVLEGPPTAETRGWRVLSTLFPFGFTVDAWDGSGLALFPAGGARRDRGARLWILLGRGSAAEVLRFDPSSGTSSPPRTYGR